MLLILLLGNNALALDLNDDVSTSLSINVSNYDVYKAEALNGVYELAEVCNNKTLIDNANNILDNYNNYIREQEIKRKEEEERIRQEQERLERERLAEQERLAQLERERLEDLARRTHKEVFRITGYCSCIECCGKWSSEVTGVESRTSSGTIPKQGRTIAVDTSVIPYGTEVIINGVSYIAEDTGGGIKGNCIDIYFNNHQDAVNWGKQYLEVTYILNN